MSRMMLLALFSLIVGGAQAAQDAGPAKSPAAANDANEIIEVRKIWDAGGHNAFTDLIRWRDQWWCSFREADGHVGPTDGKLRLIRSTDGQKWESAALIAEEGIDLRDPKLSITPDNRMMMVAGGSIYADKGKKFIGRQPRVLFSADGVKWTPPQKVLASGDWLWRVTWHDGVAYGAAYSNGNPENPKPEWALTLYSSRDGIDWSPVTEMKVPNRANETTLRFGPEGEMLALVRREEGDKLGWLGVARPPYKEWTWKPTNQRLGGPDFTRIPDGRWIAGTRYHAEGKAQTVIASLATDGTLTPLVKLPSGGDNSYPRLVWHEGLLWVSYYSSHEGKTSIYLAKVKLKPAAAQK